jgi:hypothetical protein
LYNDAPHSSVRQRTDALSYVFREALVVTLYSLKQRFGCHAIKVGELGMRRAH